MIIILVFPLIIVRPLHLNDCVSSTPLVKSAFCLLSVCVSLFIAFFLDSTLCVHFSFIEMITTSLSQRFSSMILLFRQYL